MRLLVLLMMIPCIAVANEVRVPLFAQILGDADKTPLASLVYDKESTSFSIVDVNDALPADSYCIGAEMDSNYYSCFSYIQLRYPLHYDLFIDTRQDSHLLYKLSLKPNPNAQGINPVLRTPSAGPQPLLTQLKKRQRLMKTKNPNWAMPRPLSKKTPSLTSARFSRKTGNICCLVS
ncbi:LAMI_0E08812g1_1 [Lachancea mirantina]|uniref:LAMI_0E08812g1_1 n=1 Tax=Lachancea mirantina TaxID=1230905 RepID=A0A1G4JN42_9SACH|nr:LAMI_0E08812g1_1 [Lachancea mirantina]